MHVLLSLIGLVSVSATGVATAQPRIELVTFGPGDTVPERFGHTALRVSRERRDTLYNLGHPGAEGPSFFVDVVRGDAHFVGVAGPTEEELSRYRDADRSIRRQALYLEPEATLWLSMKLRSEVEPPASSYRYDHLGDNCTTRVRDLLDAATDGALRREAERRAAHGPRPTFRELTLDGFRGHLPMLLGSDLLSGPEQDRPIDGWEELFLPAPLHDAVASVPGLARPTITTYERRGPPVQEGPPNLGRILILILSTSVALLLFASRRREVLRRAAGAGLLVVAPLIAFTGLGVSFLMASSSLSDLSWNENIFVMWPTDLLLLVPASKLLRGRSPASPRWLMIYLSIHIAAIAGLCVFKTVGWAVQDNVTVIVSTLAVLGGTLLVSLQTRSDGPASG